MNTNINPNSITIDLRAFYKDFDDIEFEPINEPINESENENDYDY